MDASALLAKHMGMRVAGAKASVYDKDDKGSLGASKEESI